MILGRSSRPKQHLHTDSTRLGPEEVTKRRQDGMTLAPALASHAWRPSLEARARRHPIPIPIPIGAAARPRHDCPTCNPKNGAFCC